MGKYFLDMEIDRLMVRMENVQTFWYILGKSGIYEYWKQ
jgi:hypothetical protein